MTHDLIITNGDSAASLLKAAGCQAEILPWRDVLHDGPVPAKASLEELSKVRISFLAEHSGMPQNEIADSFHERDYVMRNCQDFDTISLWFEHDLYDQLQLVQILNYFAELPEHPPLSLVQADDYLGYYTPETILSVEEKKTAVEESHKKLAQHVWSAFTGNDPLQLNESFEGEAFLPFWAGARRRLLEEFPDKVTGVSKTQAHILRLLSNGPKTIGRLFKESQDLESEVFMGDSSFAHCLDEMVFVPMPLIDGVALRIQESLPQDYFQQEVSLTDIGKTVLAGQANYVSLNGIQRWIGGTQISQDKLYVWDKEQECLCAA